MSAESKSPVFNEIKQISIVVDDIFAFAKNYYDKYGIGPWKVMLFSPDNTSDMIVDGKPEKYEMYLGLCESLNIQLELIQPISKNTTYWEFLSTHGPGIHHLCIANGEGRSLPGELAALGRGDVLLGGTDSIGLSYSYADLTEDIGFVAEMITRPADPGKSLEPIWVYPDDSAAE